MKQLNICLTGDAEEAYQILIDRFINVHAFIRNILIEEAGLDE